MHDYINMLGRAIVLYDDDERIAIKAASTMASLKSEGKPVRLRICSRTLLGCFAPLYPPATLLLPIGEYRWRPLGAVACCSLLLLTRALLMTSSHSEGGTWGGQRVCAVGWVERNDGAIPGRANHVASRRRGRSGLLLGVDRRKLGVAKGAHGRDASGYHVVTRGHIACNFASNFKGDIEVLQNNIARGKGKTVMLRRTATTLFT